MTWTWVWRFYTLGALLKVSAMVRGPRVTSRVEMAVASDLIASLFLQLLAGVIAVVLISRMFRAGDDPEREAE